MAKKLSLREASLERRALRLLADVGRLESLVASANRNEDYFRSANVRQRTEYEGVVNNLRRDHQAQVDRIRSEYERQASAARTQHRNEMLAKDVQIKQLQSVLTAATAAIAKGGAVVVYG